jgi:hypothetical protein
MSSSSNSRFNRFAFRLRCCSDRRLWQQLDCLKHSSSRSDFGEFDQLRLKHRANQLFRELECLKQSILRSDQLGLKISRQKAVLAPTLPADLCPLVMARWRSRLFSIR